MNDENQTTRSLATRGLAIVGIVAVLLIGAWLAVVAIRVAPNAASTLASTFFSLSSVFTSRENITLSIPKETLVSGESFALSWEHAGKETDGAYTFSYFCVDGIHFTAPSDLSGETTIYCNTPFRFINQDNTLFLSPHSERGLSEDVELRIQFTPNGESNPSSTGSLV